MNYDHAQLIKDNTIIPVSFELIKAITSHDWENVFVKPINWDGFEPDEFNYSSHKNVRKIYPYAPGVIFYYHVNNDKTINYDIYMYDDDSGHELLAYLDNSNRGNEINVNECEFLFNKKNNYINFSSENDEFDDIAFSYPFTKEDYFNITLIANITVSYETLKEILEYDYLDGFAVNYYDY